MSKSWEPRYRPKKKIDPNRRINLYKIAWPIKGATPNAPPTGSQVKEMVIRAKEVVADKLQGHGKIMADGCAWDPKRNCWIYEFYLHVEGMS